jgi:hypothetical protein
MTYPVGRSVRSHALPHTRPAEPVGYGGPQCEIRNLPDNVVQDIIAHDLGHVYQYAVGANGDGSGHSARTTEEFWLNDLADLDTAENRAAWMSGTAEEWATESLLAAREAYSIPGTNKRLKSGQKLGDEYQAKHLPVVRRRLYQAGVRLAMILNEAFEEN